MTGKIIILILLSGGFVSSIFATTIVPEKEHSNSINVTNSDLTGAYTLIPRPAHFGVSFNIFAQFSINSSPLRILNFEQDGFSPANLIIIQSTNIVMSGHIELVGKKADVIFITRDQAGDIECANCSFSGFTKISLVAGDFDSPDLDSSNNIGNVKTQGHISIDGMKAPGSLEVKIIAKSIETKGEITTHQYVTKLGEEYVPDPQGKYELGGGSFKIYAGNLKVDFSTGIITKMFPEFGSQNSSDFNSITGSMKSTMISINLSDKDADVGAHFNTRSDLVSTYQYDNKVIAHDETLLIQNFTGNLFIDSIANSDNSIQIHALGNLSISKNSRLEGNLCSAVAGGHIKFYGAIEAENSALAAKNILNQGLIFAFEKIELAAEDHLFNSYGGQIRGNEVLLSSKNGIVTNGSRTPYYDVDYNQEFEKEPNKLSGTELGVYYRQSIESGDQYRSVVADTLSASIAASHLSIRAQAVENINPYYVYPKQSPLGAETVIIDRDLANQVLMTAEKTLNIIASKYILNSSAVLRLDGSDSAAINIETGYLVNERYRAQILLEQEGNDWSKSLSYYSPAGIIRGFGDFFLKSDGGFLNNTAFFEIFGNVTIDTGLASNENSTNKILDIGIRVTQKTYESYMKLYPYCPYERHKGVCPVPIEGQFQPAEREILRDAELNSLFFVGGNFYGPKSQVNVNKHDPASEYKKIAVEKYVDGREYSIDASTDTIVVPNCNHRWVVYKWELICQEPTTKSLTEVVVDYLKEL